MCCWPWPDIFQNERSHVELGSTCDVSRTDCAAEFEQEASKRVVCNDIYG